MKQYSTVNSFRLSMRFRIFFILFFLDILLFSSFFIHGKVFLAADTLYQYYPWKYYAPQNFRPHNPLITDPVNSSYPATYNKQLKEGTLSLWNPTVLTGMPGVAGTAGRATGPYFPMNMLLHRFFSAPVAVTLFLFIHVLLMGLFMYYYLSEIGAGWRGALFGAIAYMFNGCAMVWLEFEIWVAIGAYLPLLLVFMERYTGSRRFGYAFAGGIVYGAMFLNTAFQLILYVSLFISCYIIFLIAREGKRGVVPLLTCFAITVFIGILIGAIEIFPFLEMASHSSRIARTFDFEHFFNTMAKVPFRFFVTLFFPDYFGSPPLFLNVIPRLPSQEYMNYNELTLYMGSATVFAVTAGLIAGKNIFLRFYLFMILLIVAMITGSYAYYPLFKLIPGMNQMNPTRLIFLFVFVFSAAAGLGVRGLFEMDQNKKKIFIVASALIFAGVCFISFCSNWPALTRWFNSEQFDFIQPSLADSLMKLLNDMRDLSSPIVYRPLIITTTAFCLFMLLLVVKNSKMLNIVFFIILALLSFDLISFGKNYNTTVAPELVYAKKPSIEFLLKQSGPFRVLQDRDNGFYVNTLLPFGLEEIGGYASVYPDRINKMMSFIRYGNKTFDGDVFDRWVVFGSRSTDFSSRFFDLMNVRYFLTAPGAVISNKKFKLVYRKDITIYENTEAMPRIFLVHDYVVMSKLDQELNYIASGAFDMRKQVVLEKEPSPAFAGVHILRHPENVSIESYTPDEVDVSTDLSADGWLVLSDAYYPGWTAEIDGKNAEIQRANVNFRALALRKGRHQVSFRFKPISFRAGMAMSIVGVVLAVLGIVVSRRFENQAISI